jgi:hypothetical protein
MRQRAHDLEPVTRGPQRRVAQYRAQRGDLLGLPPRQIGECAVLDLAALAIGLGQQDRRGRAALRDDGHVPALLRSFEAAADPRELTELSTPQLP